MTTFSLLQRSAVPLFGTQSNILPFMMQSQSQSEWCWAAVAASVSHFFNASSPWTQCTLVNAELGQTTCCQDGSTPQCNQPWYLDQALSQTGNLASWSAGTSAYATLVQEVDAGRPLGVRIGWPGPDNGGHFVVLDGYTDPNTVDVQDPWYGHSVSDYNAFCTQYQGNGTWTHSYFLQG